MNLILLRGKSNSFHVCFVQESVQFICTCVCSSQIMRTFHFEVNSLFKKITRSITEERCYFKCGAWWLKLDWAVETAHPSFTTGFSEDNLSHETPQWQTVPLTSPWMLRGWNASCWVPRPPLSCPVLLRSRGKVCDMTALGARVSQERWEYGVCDAPRRALSSGLHWWRLTAKCRVASHYILCSLNNKLQRHKTRCK